MMTKYGLLTAEDAMERGFVPAHVFVDGVEHQNVVVVNDVEGWIEVAKSDPVKGCPYVEYFENDPEKSYIPTERIYGEVVYFPCSYGGHK